MKQRPEITDVWNGVLGVLPWFSLFHSETELQFLTTIYKVYTWNTFFLFRFKNKKGSGGLPTMNYEWLGSLKISLCSRTYTQTLEWFKRIIGNPLICYLLSIKRLSKRKVFNTVVKHSRILRKYIPGKPETADRPGRRPDKTWLPRSCFHVDRSPSEGELARLANCTRGMGRPCHKPDRRCSLHLRGGRTDRQECARKDSRVLLSAITAPCTVFKTTLYRWKTSRAAVFEKGFSLTHKMPRRLSIYCLLLSNKWRII